MIAIEVAKNIKWFFVNKKNKKWLDASEEEICKGLSKWYKDATGETLDLNNPKTFNQKLQWLKLYDSTEKKAMLADKYAVRKWINEKIGNEYLIPCLGVWNQFSDINFDSLPDKFVLKTNHGSSTNVIVTDKKALNKKVIKLRFDRWLSTNYALKMGFELHYGMMNPQIICEMYMGENLTDYKLFCFNGVPEFFWVDTGRFTDHKRNTYDLNWKEMPFVIGNFDRVDVERPKNLEKMISLAKILADGFCFVRIDFYEIDEKLYFGEMTFTSLSGRGPFNPHEYDEKYGELIMLPKKKAIPLNEIKKYWR